MAKKLNQIDLDILEFIKDDPNSANFNNFVNKFGSENIEALNFLQASDYVKIPDNGNIKMLYKGDKYLLNNSEKYKLTPI